MSAHYNATIEQAGRALASSRALFREGLIPECHSHMVIAQHALIAAWRERKPNATAESAEPATDPQEQALAALARAGYRDLSRLRAALAATAEVSHASLRVDAASLDLQLIWAEVERLSSFSVRSFTPPQVRLRIRRRWAALVVSVGLIALVLFLRLRARPHAHASAEYSDVHAAVHTTDGLGATEWLLPDDTLGWLDITLPFARTIHRVRLFNAHNVFFLDRATRDVRVTAFSEKGPVGSVTGGFTQLDPDQSILDLPLEANDVIRVRIDVLSYFKRGAGLADVELH